MSDAEVIDRRYEDLVYARTMTYNDCANKYNQPLRPIPFHRIFNPQPVI